MEAELLEQVGTAGAGGLTIASLALLALVRLVWLLGGLAAPFKEFAASMTTTLAAHLEHLNEEKRHHQALEEAATEQIKLLRTIASTSPHMAAHAAVAQE